jgi:type IV secretion system protein VirB10
MEGKGIQSPVELDESGWRGRVAGVTRIGARAGIVATLAFALLFGLIVYGISTSGHRRASGANNLAKLTKASEHHTPWWTGFPNGQPALPVLPSALPTPARIPSLSSHADDARLQQRAPDGQASAQMHELEVKREQEARRRALLDATARASIVVRLDVGGVETGPLRQPPSAVPTAPPPGLPLSAAAHQDLPTQDSRGFLATVGLSRDRLFTARQDDPSPYELHAGSIIPATLLTGINADLPGTILAQVRADVFDSVTGRYLLVPRGTKLIGAYDSRIAQGQRRVLVAWTRLLYPDGSSLDLLGMAGTDPAGYAGFGAKVEEHLSKTFNAALLLSIISAGAQLSQPQRSASLNAAPDIGQTIAGAIGQQIGNTSIQLTQRQLQITPTLEVPPGYLFDVLVDRDIVLLAPYGDVGAP